jgi:hypothetical protein
MENNILYKGDNLFILLKDDKFITKRGGQHFKYNLIPENEIWISTNSSEEDILYIIIYELYERALMKKNIDLIKAEIEAKKIETIARSIKDKKILRKYILDLIKVNNNTIKIEG